MKPSTPTNCGRATQAVPLPPHLPSPVAQGALCAPAPAPPPPSPLYSAPPFANLAVEAEQQQHEEEQGSPERGHRHQRDGPGIGDESQARP